jgi:hypothetical protein
MMSPGPGRSRSSIETSGLGATPAGSLTQDGAYVQQPVAQRPQQIASTSSPDHLRLREPVTQPLSLGIH